MNSLLTSLTPTVITTKYHLPLRSNPYNESSCNSLQMELFIGSWCISQMIRFVFMEKCSEHIPSKLITRVRDSNSDCCIYYCSKNTSYSSTSEKSAPVRKVPISCSWPSGSLYLSPNWVWRTQVDPSKVDLM